MRDRLIELCENLILSCKASLCEDCEHNNVDYPHCMSVHFADYLLANGVIVPPCKVGDTVWYELYGQIESAVVYSCVGNLTRGGLKITDANAKSADGVEVAFNGKCLGKNVFLAREEAERVLAERKDK